MQQPTNLSNFVCFGGKSKETKFRFAIEQRRVAVVAVSRNRVCVLGLV